MHPGSATDTSVELGAEQVRHFESLWRRERQLVLTRVASSLAHALGTPLNVIAGRAALASMGGVSEAEVAENCQIISRQVRSITALLQEVLKFAREGESPKEQVDLVQLIQQAANLLGPLAASNKVELVPASGTPSLVRSLEQGAVLQVLTGALSMAISSKKPPTRINLAVRVGHAEPPPSERGRVQPGEYAQFALELMGLRLDDKLLEHVYEPWLHSAGLDRDAALSLAMMYGVAREHRGWVHATNDASGSTLTLHWPV